MSFGVMVQTARGVERVDFECPGFVAPQTWEIPGWFTPREAEAIVRGALSLGPTGKLAELGTWRGRSSAILSDALGAGWQVHTVDCWPGTYVGADPVDNDPQAAAHAAVVELAPRPNVSVWRGRSEAPFALSSPFRAQPLDTGFFRVLFVDAEHSAEAVERDLRAWLPLLAARALIFLHDTTDPRVGAGVRAGAMCALEGSAWARRPDLEADSLWAFGRKESP